MALTDENGMVMPVSPMGGGFGNGFGFGGDGAWLILFILFAMGGWGNGFGGGFGADSMYPWLANGQNGINANINGGFRDAMLNDGITSIRDGIGNLGTQICGGFASVEQGANARQIANMQTAFANQTAMSQGFYDVSSQLAQCCCDNRLATAQTQALVQSENCADRQALSDGIRDIIANQTAGTQRILDMMCQDKIDEKNDKIIELQNKLNMADFAASQASQNNYLQNALTAQTQYFLSLYPRPSETTPTTTTTP